MPVSPRPVVALAALTAAVTATSLLSNAAGDADAAVTSPRTGAAVSPAAGAAVGTTASGSAGVSRPFTVTLITGDKVTVTETSAGRYTPWFEPGPGRSRIRPLIRQGDGRLEVVPLDAAPLVASGRVDARFFDVLHLRALGYGDASRADIPVLATGTSAGAPERAVSPDARLTGARMFDPRARSPRARAAARVAREIPALATVSWRTDKRRAGTFWTDTTKAAHDPARTGERIWLMGRSRLALDRSVHQIGAPAAYRAGLTGRGVRVAVLDSGYDRTHPDLVRAVVASRDFTGSTVGVTDLVGHGTHVASVLAGRGTASKGSYAGVAKGADLVVGKVCPETYCDGDAILAGMVWATTSMRAKVVNLSFGHRISDGPDPLVQAVDALTQRTGALFVVSAGNYGPEPRTIEAPGSAASALTVGSVDRHDVVSSFSARGPWVPPSRTSGFGLKPDLVAPGEGIVAARAAAAGAHVLPIAAGSRYTALSGTSMAAPHVAGAAALLAQQHPTWRATQLKAALTAAAAPVTAAREAPEAAPVTRADLSPYVQGAGRLDVARAVAGGVSALGALDFGYSAWPNADAPAVTRRVTFTNATASPVELHLRAALRGEKGKDASTALTLGASRVVIPAATANGPGTVSVPVTYRPGEGPVGARSGHLSATSADGRFRLRVAIGGYREPESYNLTVRALDSRGRPTDGKRTFTDAFVVDTLTGDYRPAVPDGRTPLRVGARGSVLYVAVIEQRPDDTIARVTMAARSLGIHRNTAVAVDARHGRRVDVVLARSGTAPAPISDGFVLQQETRRQGGVNLAFFPDRGTLHLVPSGPVPGMSATLWRDFVKAGTSGPGQPASPFVYHTTPSIFERFPQTPTLRVDPHDFAAIRNTYARQHPAERISTQLMQSKAGAGMGLTPLPLGALRQRTDFVATDVEAQPRTLLEGIGADGFLEAEDRTYGPRTTTDLTWNRAVLSVSVADAGVLRLSRHADGRLAGDLNLVSDADGNLGSRQAQGTDRIRVLHNGRVIHSSDDVYGLEAPVGHAKGTFRVEVSTAVIAPRGSTLRALTTRQTVAWTFRSSPVTGAPQPLPVRTVRFAPPLDALNRAPTGRALTVPLRIEHPVGTPAPVVRSLVVQASFDRGRSWVLLRPRLDRGGAWSVAVQPPASAASVSFRSVLVDRDGNRAEQSIIDAYRTR